MTIDFGNQVLAGVSDPINPQDAATKNYVDTTTATAAQGALADTALQNIVEDITPQLGGDLDLQSFILTTSVVDGNIVITPNGNGQVIVGSVSQPGIIQADNDQPFTLFGGDSVSANAGSLFLRGGNGASTFASGDVVLLPGTGGASDGSVIIGGIVWPSADGGSGQVLTTDGLGSLSFETPFSEVSEDTTPQLGGNLDAANFAINNLLDPVAAQDAATKNYVDNNSINATTENKSQLLTLIDAVNISWNLDDGAVAEITLTADRVLDNPTNIKAGGRYELIVRQDSVGGQDLTFGSAFKWQNGDEPNFSSAAPNAVDLLKFTSDGTNLYGEVLRNLA